MVKLRRRWSFARAATALLRTLDAEQAHRLGLMALPLLYRGESPRPDPVLATTVWGHRFANPLGLAAGFDKNAEVVRAVFAMGFGFAEFGTVTLRPQPGNPRPRLFRLPDDAAVINRFGFNNRGLAAAIAALKRARTGGVTGPVGLNLGVNRDSAAPEVDLALALGQTPSVVDFIVVNISSPNTPGLRRLQDADRLARLTRHLADVRDAEGLAQPILIKIAPDLEDDAIRRIADDVLGAGLDGIVATNTTLARPASLASPARHETGGLSGAPLFERSTEIVRLLYRHVGGRLPIVGVGGVRNGADAYAKIRAGASLVELYTALVYAGPDVVATITADLAARIRRDGFASVADAVGRDAG